MYILKCPDCGKLYSLDETPSRGTNRAAACLNCGNVIPLHIHQLLTSLHRAVNDDSSYGWQLYWVPDDATIESTVTFHVKPSE